MNLKERKYLLRRYTNRFRYLFFRLYKIDYIRVNSRDILNSILIGAGMISLSSILQIVLVDSQILDDRIRRSVIGIRLSLILLPALFYFYLSRTRIIINQKFGTHLMVLLMILVLLHIPLMLLDPSNHVHYLLGSATILLGSSVLLWIEPVRVAVIALAFLLLNLPISMEISKDLFFSSQSILENVLNVGVILVISGLANTMINYWRFEDFRTNKRLKKTLKNLKATNEKIRILSHQDSLTSLYNRRYLLEEFDNRSQEFRKLGKSFGLVILDLDHLKRINDQFGHIQGDRAIVRLSEVLKTQVQAKDIIARIGGDEFCILTHETSAVSLKEMIETIRRHVSETEMPVYDNANIKHNLTASIGAVLVDETQPKNFDILYHKIDDALYQAKTSGRNMAILLDS